jgi:hypothetical protein
MDSNAYSSALPLDMEKLNSITVGKSTFQEELLEMVFNNITECITIMESCTSENMYDKWCDALEEIRSISSSVGAQELAKLCLMTQKIAHPGEDEKTKIIHALKSNTQKLRVFLRNTRY